MAVATLSEPLLIDLSKEIWEKHLDRAEVWFGNVLLTQARFRSLLESTADKIYEPRIQRYLRDMFGPAREHEEKAKQLCRLIGKEPSTVRQTTGSIASKASEIMADVVGLAGSATGGWKDLRQLLLVNQDAIGAFGIAEQLGYALGLEKVAELAFTVVNDKTRDQLLLQEYMLEMGPVAILYHAEV